MQVLAVVLLFASHRNPFLFVEKPKPVVVAPKRANAVVIAPAPQRVVVAAPVVEAPPPPPKFPYRCIGRFGPDSDPFAVLDAGGTIINVKAGDVVDGKWRIVAVGIDDVTAVPIAP
jgi:hypothetical protein